MIAAVLLACVVAQAVDAGTITGRVVDVGTGGSVGAVMVSIQGAGMTINPLPHQPAQILTGADGRFVFRDLGPGSYIIRATKGGYSEGASGRRRPDGDPQSIELSASVRSGDTLIRIWKQGAIGGTVTDEAGEPMIGVAMRLLLRAKAGSTPPPPTSNNFVAYAWTYSVVGTPTQTDDRGIYRFSELSAGDYLVVAALPPVSGTRTVVEDAQREGRGRADLATLAGLGPFSDPRGFTAPTRIGDALVGGGGSMLLPPTRGRRPRIYPVTFYPGATSVAQAATVALATGEERDGIDIQLRPVPIARVSGIVIGPDGPASTTTLRLSPVGADELPAAFEAPASISDGAGNFVFAAVPAGQYTLSGALPRMGGLIRVPIVVASDDVDGLVVAAQAPLRLTAALQFDGATTPPTADAKGTGPLPLPGLVLDHVGPVVVPDQLEWIRGNVGQTMIVIGYGPGRYRVRVPTSPAGWMFKAALLNGVDVSETPFDFTRDVPDLTLVFTDRWTGVSGSVQGTNAAAAIVLAFPADASKWTGDGFAPRRFKTARPDPRGEFGMSSLPPGDYFLVALAEDQADNWRDPSTLELLAGVASTITIGDGEHKTINLQVREARH